MYDERDFYPRPHMEGDDHTSSIRGGEKNISTHALTWRATTAVFYPARKGLISTHALTWRATVQAELDSLKAIFLPTPSHGGRPRVTGSPSPTWEFLPTPSHGGRLERWCSPSPALGISTHALTWRATGSNRLTKNITSFLPTPSHGGRPIGPQGEQGPKDFYPRPHMEGDITTTKTCKYITISTHALTWRATQYRYRPGCDTQFLPTPSHGGRPWNSGSCNSGS